MRLFCWILGALCLVALQIDGVATAQQPGRDGMWLVESLDTQSQSTTLYAGKKPYLSARLLPAKLAKLSEDLVDEETDKLLIKHDSQLVLISVGYGLNAAEDLYCTYRDINKSSANPLPRSIVSNKLICLSDKLGDSKFDFYVLCWALYPNLMIDGKCHKEHHKVRKSSYDMIDVSNYNSAMRYEMRYQGNGGFTIYAADCYLSVPPPEGIVNKSNELPWAGGTLLVEYFDKDKIIFKNRAFEFNAAINISRPWYWF